MVACFGFPVTEVPFLQAPCEWLMDTSLREGVLGSLGSVFSWLRLGEGQLWGPWGDSLRSPCACPHSFQPGSLDTVQKGEGEAQHVAES